MPGTPRGKTTDATLGLALLQPRTKPKVATKDQGLGGMDTCICMTETLHRSSETITTLLIGHTPVQNVLVFKKTCKLNFIKKCCQNIQHPMLDQAHQRWRFHMLLAILGSPPQSPSSNPNL